MVQFHQFSILAIDKPMQSIYTDDIMIKKRFFHQTE